MAPDLSAEGTPSDTVWGASGGKRARGGDGFHLLRESFPRQVDKKSRGPQGEKGLEFSKRKKGQTFFLLYKSSVQFSRSVVSDSLRPHDLQDARPHCPSPTPGVHSDSHLDSVMLYNHLILCRPLLLLPPIPPSIRVFSNESTLHMRWPKDWSFSFSIIPSKEIPGLISFRMD